MDPKLGRNDENFERIVRGLREAGRGLVLFPECALSGYGFESKEEGLRHAEEAPGRFTDRLVEVCRETGNWAVVGFLEKRGSDLFNSAALAGPEGLAGVYRKMHLPFLGIDRFATLGDLGFPVFETPLGRIGLLICYDGSFPEASRVLKLSGAQLICLPTNWPSTSVVQRLYSPPMRAQENHVNFVSCNRTGSESGFTFRGESRICSFEGEVLAEAGPGEESISAELDLDAADRNRVVHVPGLYELDRLGHRRPEHYGALAAPAAARDPVT